MLYEVKKAKQMYRAASDNSLLRIANDSFSSLRPEIIPVLISELKKRNIGEVIINKYESHYDLLDEACVKEWMDKIRGSVCPDCNKKGLGLLCYNGRTTSSYLIKSVYLNRTFISCTYCRSEKLRSLNLDTFLLGWWSFFGFFTTIYSIVQNLINSILPSHKEQENMYRYVVYHHSQLVDHEDQITEYLDLNNKA